MSEKKRITNDMLTIMRDEKIIILADWLKIRGTLKNWIKVYVVLKPGIMLLYKCDKIKSAGNWIGTVLLNSCELLERPSKKHGFCFKLFHPLEKSIWASKVNYSIEKNKNRIIFSQIQKLHLYRVQMERVV